ncbi:hypothetical protein, variant 1 [Cladophialophora immunda]|uniref:Methyltransferase domain-containing protein n=1 Tax=Cladophialophora immunda TaxID=569365 RepID=A0A0D2CZ73_9EURO|nr:hypothetical protein, variant 1 [Cladophialophora immunda]KIW28874.1 hypothetical protein, variant 1 [Cladophialophora immunda]
MQTDHDSAYESDNSQATNTTSIPTDILDGQRQYGRRYHRYRQSTYLIPDDEIQQSCLDLFHCYCTALLGGKHYLAPVPEQSDRVLDLGCGTGTWAVQVADDHPNWQVTGIDLSPIQPTWVPPNLTFVLDDMEDHWTHGEPFDFIHSRQTGGSVKNWPELIQQCYANLKNLGWIEFQELDYSHQALEGVAEEKSLVRLADTLTMKAFRALGRELSVGGEIQGWLENKGFVNVQHRVFKVPLGPWPCDMRLVSVPAPPAVLTIKSQQKVIGDLRLCEYREGLEGLVLKPFVYGLGWSSENVREFVKQVCDEADNQKFPLWCQL